MREDWDRAIREGDVEELRTLLARGADIDDKDRYGQTALMRASHNGQIEVVRILVDSGAELDTTAKYNLSAFMLAVICGHGEIVHILVRAGADQSIRGTGAPGFSGKTALELAEDKGLTEAVAALREATR